MGGKKALVVIDVQNDFLPDKGALAVPHGNEVIPVINLLLDLPFDHVVATRDFHPKNHASFASTWNRQVGDRVQIQGKEQILWPDHCVQGTFGAEFPKTLHTERFEKIIFNKGTEKEYDSYSAFYNDGSTTGFASFLQEKGVEELYFVGLATDYCVLFSVLDALDAGFQVYVILEACRGVELQAGDVACAIETMQKKGAHILSFSEAKQRVHS